MNIADELTDGPDKRGKSFFLHRQVEANDQYR